MTISFGMIDKDKSGDGIEIHVLLCMKHRINTICCCSRTREMHVTSQEAEDKRQQMLGT
jgi:hypothetical protein